MRVSAALLLVLWLGGCQYLGIAPTPESQLFVACTGYKTLLRNITLVASEMSVAQKDMVDGVILVIGPICKEASEGKVADAGIVLTAVNAELRRLLLLERGLK